jgi:hypothetical protein
VYSQLRVTFLGASLKPIQIRDPPKVPYHIFFKRQCRIMTFQRQNKKFVAISIGGERQLSEKPQKYLIDGLIASWFALNSPY